MPTTSSAEPDRLFRFVVASGQLNAGLLAEVTALGAALDQVHRTCGDASSLFARLDRDLAELLREVDQVARVF